MILGTHSSFNLFFVFMHVAGLAFANVETWIVVQNNVRMHVDNRSLGRVSSFKTLLLYTEDCRLLSVWCPSCFRQPLVYLVKSVI